jgi:hypothetical protein
MFTRVEESNIKAGNGYVHPVGNALAFINLVDWVLLSTVDTAHMAFEIPLLCSTFASAVQHCGLARELMNGEQLTTFVPVDAA